MRLRAKHPLLVLALLAPLATACNRTTVTTGSVDGKSAAAPPPLLPGTLEWRTAKADDAATVIVALHGMSDTPENFESAFEGFGGNAVFLFPRAWNPNGGGYSWFTYRDGMSDAEWGAEVGASEARLWQSLEGALAHRRVVVVGFSQGGILSFTMAARHPDVVACALPISASLPGALFPTTRPAKTIAFHGIDDQVMSIVWGRQTVQGFVSLGGDAVLHEYAGVGHGLSPAMKKDLFDALAGCVR